MNEKIFTDDSPVLLDSNILAYVFDDSHPGKRDVCRHLVRRCWRGEAEYAVSVQNFSEFYVIVTEKVEKPIPREVAAEFVSLVIDFDGWRVVSIHGSTVARATEITGEHGVPYWDALIAAAMEENGIRRILTENEADFGPVPGVEVRNPIRERRSG
jgi:predicted nucleic acid-binding protein